MANAICSILDCDKPVRSNGMCSTHSGNKHKYGHAIPVRDWPLIARLMGVGWDIDERGCWIWRGSRSEKGYGLISLRRRGATATGDRVHRLMWEMHNEPIPDGMVVRHRCDTPPCINPDHLELGTNKQNSRDMVERKRSLAYSTGRYDGVCVNGKHDVTQPGSLKEVAKKGKGTYWTCVGCDRDRKRKYHENVTVPRRAAEKAAREAAGRKAA